MFVSPCTIRSAQCAALIALAAAAGIARTPSEPAESRGSSRQNPAIEATVGSHATHLRAPWLTSSLATWMRTVSIWLSVSQRDPSHEPHQSDGPANEGGLSAVPGKGADSISAPAISANSPAAAAPSASFGPRTHRWPHAVGPPAASRSTLPPAAGTTVPGDSAANGTSVLRFLRITPVDAVTSLSRLARCPAPPHPTDGNTLTLAGASGLVPRDRVSALPGTGVFAARSFP